MSLRCFALIALCLALPLSADASDSEPPLSADRILDAVIQGFPDTRISVSGSLLVRQRRGVPIATYGFTLEAHWLGPDTQVAYTILDTHGTPIEAMQFRSGHADDFLYRTGPNLQPAALHPLTTSIAKTDISWSDLTLHFLWWPNARHVGFDQVRGFDCYIIEVDAPPGTALSAYARVRLWISRENFLLLQAEGFDHHDTPVRRLWVQSVRKIDDQWMIHTMEVQQAANTQRTRLQVQDVLTPQD